MTKKVKRTISLIIAAIMLLSTMSVLAFADNVPHVHVAGTWKEDKAQYAQPTCVKAGKKVMVLTCAICDEVLDSTVEELPKLTSHVPAEVPAIENVKKPTCIGGSYDEVYYCRFCNKKLEVKTIPVEPVLEHVPAPAVVNQDMASKPATCKETGFHYASVYCKVCKKELNTYRVEEPKLNYHVTAKTFVKGNTRTCADGDEVCLVCGKVVNPAIPHVYDKGRYATAADKPTLTGWGTKTYTCLICGDVKTEPVPPVGPKGLNPGDVDADGFVTTADARLILRFAVGLGAIDKVIVGDGLIAVADVDANGKVEPADARLALRLAVGLRIENA